MPKAKSSAVRKRRVIIATILKKKEGAGVTMLLEKLKEYGIVTTRQTVTSDKAYLSKRDLKDYISSDTGIPLEIDRDAVDEEIRLNKQFRDETDDLNIKAKFSSILRRLGVDRGALTAKMYELRMKQIEHEKPVYNIVIGTQKEVDVAQYKKKRGEK